MAHANWFLLMITITLFILSTNEPNSYLADLKFHIRKGLYIKLWSENYIEKYIMSLQKPDGRYGLCTNGHMIN